MSSPSRRASENPRRHDLVFVSPTAWRSFLETRDELADDPLVAGWINRGWPLIARRLAADEGHGYRKKQNRDAYYETFAQFLTALRQ